MKILVCIRQGLDGEINPFDACAYEEALKVKNAEVIIISMGPPAAEDFLFRLSRLGAHRAILLSDKAFAGADTLATAYTLSLAVKRIDPELIFCGRQALVGDTGQTGSMLSQLTGRRLITNVMGIENIGRSITANTRDFGVCTVMLPALLTIEKINTLRFPSILSKPCRVEIWSAEEMNADTEKCGLQGSATRVVQTIENTSGRRSCKFISCDELQRVISQALLMRNEKTVRRVPGQHKMERVFIAGDPPRPFAEMIGEDITVLPLTNADDMIKAIREGAPNAVLWGSDALSKMVSAQTAAALGLGLCADCTSLEFDGKDLYMYRPALSGSVVAKIVSRTKPAMATVRTVKDASDIIVTAGLGARDAIDEVGKFVGKIGAELAATRKAVDLNILPYTMQVGLTGKTVSPRVYIAMGVSGAVHHITGMQKSGVVIAINSDKNAPVFDYADYGIVARVEEALRKQT